MFIQVIEGKTKDPARLQACLDRWQVDLKPHAIGYLGSTHGITRDGDAILIARFADRASAEANSARPEQSAWWAETEACFDGAPVFHDTDDVTEMRHGDPDQAGFVQVMEGTVTDRARAHEIERESDPVLAEMRPELLGSLTAYYDDDHYTTVAYFTSERDARQGERQPVPDEFAPAMEEWEHTMTVERYLDLTEPMLVKA